MPRLMMVVMLVLALTACNPKDRRPGTWLSGDLVETPISDWSFTEGYQEVFI